MKPFTFALQIVLETRIAQEAEMRRQLAVALEQQRHAAVREREAALGLSQALLAIETASSGRFSAAQREHLWSVRQAQEALCTTLRAALKDSARLTEEKRLSVIHARRHRELLERLKASRLATWQKEATQAEQHQFDEIAMTRGFQATRASQALLSPC